MSEVRSLRQKTRSDVRAEKTLQEGFSQHEESRFRFVTLTGVKSLKQVRRLIKWFRESIKEYFGVLTAEGGGVVHLVYFGNSVKYRDLSKQWLSISGYWNVSISAVTDFIGVTRELILQKKQKRYFYSKRWRKKSENHQVNLEGTVINQIYRVNNGNLPFGGRYIK